MKNAHRVRPWWTFYMWNSVVGALEQFLFADCGYEFLEIEWFEVGYVLEVAGFEGFEGWGQHGRGLRVALAEVCIRVSDDSLAFACAVADEQTWALLEIFGEAGFVDDHRGCFCDLLCVIARVLWGRGVLEYCSIDFHAAGVDHWYDVLEGYRLPRRFAPRNDVWGVACIDVWGVVIGVGVACIDVWGVACTGVSDVCNDVRGVLIGGGVACIGVV